MEGQGERKGGKGQKGREKTIYVHLYAHGGQKRRKRRGDTYATGTEIHHRRTM